MYKHILVAVDLSPRACNALKHAVKITPLFNSKYPVLVVPDIQ